MSPLFIGWSCFCWSRAGGRGVVGGLDGTGGPVGAGCWGGAGGSSRCM